MGSGILWEMNYRKLGQWGMKVSEVSLGGWLTHGRSIEDATTEQIVHRAFDLGVNFFDTADAYNAGEAEKSLAKAIKSFRRMDLVLATKCFFPISDRPNDQGLSRKHIVESVHHSLERLETDYIDLMQFHRFDPEVRIEESVRAVDDLIRQGKILYWGVSMWNSAQITEAVHVARQLNCCPPVSNQPLYNMFSREIEDRVIPASEKHGLGQVVFSPLAQGVLTGKYKPGSKVPEGSRASDDKSNMFMGGYMSDDQLRLVQKLTVIAQDHGLTMGQFALAWCLRQSNVSSVIVGATKLSHIEENVGASGAEIDAEVWETVEGLLAME